MANSYTAQVDEELKKDLDLFQTIDTEALIQQHNSNQQKAATETDENACSIPKTIEKSSSEEEVNVEEFIDILNDTDSIIVISDSSNEEN